MTGLTTTYLIPAIILNPAFILHLINTFVSRYAQPTSTISQSPHPIFESLGPMPGSTPWFDVHTHDSMCWAYTALMVLVQVFAFGKVSDNRVARKNARVARQERERSRQEEVNKKLAEKALALNTKENIAGLDGAAEVTSEKMNGDGIIIGASANSSTDSLASLGSDASTSETSEEEMMI